MAFISTKNDIKSFPFDEYAPLTGTNLELKAEAQCLTAFNTWMLPQLFNLFGNFRLSKTYSGKYDPLQVLKDNIGKDPFMIGIWRVVTQLKRSSLVKSQISPQFVEYSALVPLILAGIKKYQNIPYSAWDTNGLQHLVDSSLYEAMVCEVPDLTTERLIELREVGLTTKTGPKAGTLSKPTSKWAPTGLKHTEIGELPKLAQTMLTQIWVAHPSIRSSYMILDPTDWDNMPEPLIQERVLVSNTVIESPTLPWL